MLFAVLPWIVSFPSALAAQPSAPAPISAPLRALELGQLNFLHTTDTHGWLAGHLEELMRVADLHTRRTGGDYVSFATRMREKVEAQGQDLLVIDTGDRVEGNGLYDSSEPKGIYLSEILHHQHIDVITSGNHELYKQNTSEAEFLTTVPNFRGKYLASNIDIRHPETNELVPLAPRFKKFTTKNQGIRIVAFGFLFDFNGNYNNTVVQPVEKTIKEDWFQEAVRDAEVDLFLIAGHVPAHSPEYRAIFEEIRGIRWDTPIQFFGGHQHIRDYAKYDSKAFALASGRFMETIGFASIDGLSTGDQPSVASSPVFRRRYIDNNLYSFYQHTGLDEESFPTESGLNVSQLIAESRSALRLDHVHGCVPRTLWTSRVPYPNPDSVFTWLQTKVLPDSLKDESRGEVPSVAILNTGALRFDILKGEFTQDTIWTISPFTNSFRYVKDVPYEKVQLMMEVLNKQPKVLETLESDSKLLPLSRPENLARATYFNAEVVEEDDLNPRLVYDMAGSHQAHLSADSLDENILPGYTTKDDAGTDGDDTVHSPIAFYEVPNCIQTLLSADKSGVPKTVDLIYIEFIQPHLAMAAKFASLDVDFFKDSEVYMPSTTLTDLLLAWVKKHWKCG
ncbi:uncharacterized protein N7477_006480 [Penicillium maclennaniae]|uniref:uncharacterized protein n=1 Tax=Penicillium maclennaniae TaxID=1343394 RepID=UPI0025423C4E|nr:uncharacterized protein N7477_006480 [Penicillium maclennaniae]KAJ5667910.1 hypothetical protein N7477_006480 [Penicillium maclennaniae]